MAILELGAGTGLYGIVASMATARRVILTDGCDDVIRNLHHSVRLNRLQERAKVVRLASGKRKDPSLKLELPAEIQEHLLFKVSLQRDHSCSCLNLLYVLALAHFLYIIMYEKHLYLLGRIQSLVPFWRNSSGIPLVR